MFSHDELAGVIDLFGVLTRAELRRACSELAFKRGEESPALDGELENAVRGYELVAFERDGGVLAVEPEEVAEGTSLVAGPRAFPVLPSGAEDLPHILEATSREIDHERIGNAVEARFRGEAARAIDAENRARITELLDLSYEIEAWGPVDLGGVRDRLDGGLESVSGERSIDTSESDE